MGIVFFYRIGNFAFKYRIPIIPLLCKAIIRYLFNSAIDCSIQIGKKIHFSYGGIATVIHKNCIIGDNVIIGSCVTIGGRSKSKMVPRIGNNVFIATGAKVIGDITIGSNVVIGANSVVITDIPDNSVVAGIPGKVIKKCKNYLDYV